MSPDGLWGGGAGGEVGVWSLVEDIALWGAAAWLWWQSERLRRAEAALEAVGLADRADHDPGELSGGQMQRVAIARALVGDPEVLLVDEPTGNLDLTATREVLEILDRLHADGRTIFMITHEEDVAEHADRRLLLGEGRLHDHDSAEARA